MSRHAPPIDARQFRCLAAAIMVALVLPRVWQRGMFLDGITYAVVARNMAAGVGTFWKPSFSATTYAEFFEQLPLGMALQALAFRVLGDHLWVERLFSVGAFALTALLIVAIWRRVLPKAYDWLPLMFWILPSVITWAAINNMLENTQALFTTGAVWCLLRGWQSEAPTRRFGWTATAALAVLAGLLTKGPVGLFPLAVPPLLLLVGNDRDGHVAPAALSAQSPAPRAKRAAVNWLLLLLALSICFAILLSFEAARMSLLEFSRTHLLPALEGERGVGDRASDIARHLTLGIWARMGALAAVLWLIRPRGRPTHPVPFAVAGFFFLVGLGASLPVLASPVLAGHYFVPSVPFFAMAAAALSLPAVAVFRGASSGRVRRLFPALLSAALVVAAILVLVFRGPMEARDRRRLAALDAVDPIIPRGATIGTCPTAAADWGLQSYLQRLYRVSVDARSVAVNGWFLVADAGCAAPTGCVARAGDSRIQLYRCAAPPRLTRGGARFSSTLRATRGGGGARRPNAPVRECR